MSSPRTRADSKVSRPTTAPDHIARAAARVLLGKAALQDKADQAPAKTAAVTASAKISGFIVVPPKDRPPKHVWWPFARTGRKRAAQIARWRKPGDAFDPQELQATFLARCGNM